MNGFADVNHELKREQATTDYADYTDKDRSELSDPVFVAVVSTVLSGFCLGAATPDFSGRMDSARRPFPRYRGQCMGNEVRF